MIRKSSKIKASLILSLLTISTRTWASDRAVIFLEPGTKIIDPESRILVLGTDDCPRWLIDRKTAEYIDVQTNDLRACRTELSECQKRAVPPTEFFHSSTWHTIELIGIFGLVGGAYYEGTK